MPIHARFAEHVKNAALAALINAKKKFTGDPMPPFTATDLDEHFLKASGEMARRQSSVKTVPDYVNSVTAFHNENPPALEQGDFMDLTSPTNVATIQSFFTMNSGNVLLAPMVYFIRHKNRKELKRVELYLFNNSTAKELVTVMWEDQ